ncbi:hypothetical protein BRC70_00440 [Halobacteriales archaeon QH_6_68_27]|nr:MAG: hypothetical protein BRC70_00440 [Halobacteriales archaeon QH_6_68_27]
MAHDGHAPGGPPEGGPTGDARTDRRPRSVETTPQALYLWQIAVLEARLDIEAARAERAERDRQHVIDRYEALLDDRPAGELHTDGGRPPSDRGDEANAAERTVDRVRSLF